MSDTNIFKVLADKQRRDILVMLKNGRMNAGEIAEELGITPAALSYHLKLLKGADLIILWIISFISLAGTAIVLQFMPERVPMHYDMAGNIDRWGSKYENLVFPLIILLLSLFWTMFIRFFEKKADKVSDEKESTGARSNAKVLSIVGISMAAMFTVMQGFI